MNTNLNLTSKDICLLATKGSIGRVWLALSQPLVPGERRRYSARANLSLNEIRIFPLQISPSDVASLLHELSEAKPYTDDNWETASIDFSSLNITINIRLMDGQFGESERRGVETIIGRLHGLTQSVTQTMTNSDDETRNEDHQFSWILSWIDIDFDDGEVDLCYDGITYNAQWNKTFQIPRHGPPAT